VSHYDVLGVPRDASTSQIRAAFRELARANHPDTSASGSAASLSPINEAWRVLGDPVLRRAYDRSLDAARERGAPVAERAPVHLQPPPESSFPWRFLVGMLIVGIAIVIFGVITYTPSKPPPPDNLLQTGSCVIIEDNGDASEVSCNEDRDGVVQSLVTTADQCPVDLEPHRDRQGLGVVCVLFDV
jgi:molecular chaperone DnaJ